MQKIKKNLSLFLKLLFLVGVTSCSSWKKKAGSQEPPRMKTSFHFEPTTVDTRKNADGNTSTLHFLLYEGLTRLRSDGEVDLALAESVDISADGLTYLFTLRNASWTDGTPITAHDFEYSWKQILNPAFGSPSAQLLFILKNGEEAFKENLSPTEIGVQALDDQTLRVDLKAPAPYFLSLASFCAFYPIPKHIAEESSDWKLRRDQTLVTSGPFQLVEWKPNEEIRLKKNPHYWDVDRVGLSEIDFAIIPDEITAAQLFDRGDLDFLSTITTPLNQEDLFRYERKGTLKTSPIAGLVYCAFNLTHPIFENLNIRKAFSLSIDRKTIAREITSLHERPANRVVPPMLYDHPVSSLIPENAEREAVRYFQSGLRELNLASLPKLTLIYQSTDPFRQVALALQDQWKEILGIEIELQEYEARSLSELIVSRKYALCLDCMMLQCNDPVYILDRFKYKTLRKNIPGFEDSLYIEQLDQASQQVNRQKRMIGLEKGEKILLSHMPIAPLYFINQGVLIQPKFTHVEFSPIGNLLFKNVQMIAQPDPVHSPHAD